MTCTAIRLVNQTAHGPIRLLTNTIRHFVCQAFQEIFSAG